MRRLAAVLTATAILFARGVSAEEGTVYSSVNAVGHKNAGSTREITNIAEVDRSAPIEPIKPVKAKKLPASRAHHDTSGEEISGALKKVLGRVLEWGAGTVYIASSELLAVKGVKLEEIADVSFLPDPGVYNAEEYEVYVSDIKPKAAKKNKKKKKNAPDMLYVRVVEKRVREETDEAETDEAETDEAETDEAETDEAETDEAATDRPEPPYGMEIKVKAANYYPGIWMDKSPRFTLSGIPSDAARYAYAVIAYDERFVILSKDEFMALDEGAYSLCFTILDGIGDIVATSEKYDLMLDFTVPVNLYVNMMQGSKKSFVVSAEDAVSGIDAYSVDGGYSWHKPEKNGGYTHTSKPGYTFTAGSIMARDKAGNIAIYPGDFALPEKTSGGGGGGSKTKKVKHSPPGVTDFDPYDSLELKLPKDDMTVLTVGDDRLPLTLEDDKGKTVSFRASFAAWGADAANAKVDTLVLTAPKDDRQANWKFNGVVYKMLANSGINYLCFRHGDGAAAVSTAGFTAGTAYAKLKAQGVSTKKFDYSVSQTGVSANFAVTVQPDEGIAEQFSLTTDSKKEMYLYDAVVGEANIMSLPFDADDEREE